VVTAPGAPALDGGHAAIRLDDGSVLVVGGRRGGTAQAEVWRFRPRLLGPFASSLSVVPGDDESDPPLAPLDPSLVTSTLPWRLRGAGMGLSHAIVGGPSGGPLRVEVTATVPGDGIALVLGHVDAAEMHRVILIPGMAASLERRAAGAVTRPCSGQMVPAAGPTVITLDARDGVVRVAMGGQVVLSCEVEALPPGRVGVGALGAGEVELVTIAVNR
jgi:hypothetical protein